MLPSALYCHRSQPMTFQYSGPMSPFLLALRAQVIPAALIPFLYDIRPPVSFVDGCLVVEIQDFRKTPEMRSRVVMRPAAEALAQTIDVMLERKGENWDEMMALELESRIMVSSKRCTLLMPGRDVPTAVPRHLHPRHAQRRPRHVFDHARGTQSGSRWDIPRPDSSRIWRRQIRGRTHAQVTARGRAYRPIPA